MPNHRSFMLFAAAALLAANVHAAATASGSHTTAASSKAAAPAAATAPVKSDVPPDLAKEAKISLDTARATALSRVKGGSVRSEELEREGGKLIYSFDVVVAGKSGVTEVNVDAKSGKVLNVHHESPAKEKREATQEGKAKPPGHG